MTQKGNSETVRSKGYLDKNAFAEAVNAYSLSLAARTDAPENLQSLPHSQVKPTNPTPTTQRKDESDNSFVLGWRLLGVTCRMVSTERLLGNPAKQTSWAWGLRSRVKESWACSALSESEV